MSNDIYDKIRRSYKEARNVNSGKLRAIVGDQMALATHVITPICGIAASILLIVHGQQFLDAIYRTCCIKKRLAIMDTIKSTVEAVTGVGTPASHLNLED